MRVAFSLAGLLLTCGCSGTHSLPATAAPPGTFDVSAQLAATCSGCHAAGNADLVELNGRSEAELFGAVSVYKLDTEGQTVMHRIARGYSDDELKAVSAYLSKQEP